MEQPTLNHDERIAASIALHEYIDALQSLNKDLALWVDRLLAILQRHNIIDPIIEEISKTATSVGIKSNWNKATKIMSGEIP